MARFRKWPILTFVLLIDIYAQSQKIFFEQLTTAEGLPSDYVTCLFEDSKGYLWIGTDKGACRYDGRMFQYFSNDIGLPSNFISCFAEDPRGNIWIGTGTAGACIFDGRNLKSFSLPGNQNESIKEIHFNTDSSFFIVSEHFGLSYFHNTTTAPRTFGTYSFIKKIGDNLFFTGDYDQFYILEKKGQQLLFHPHPAPSDKNNFFAWLSNNSIIVLNEHSLLNYIVDRRKWVVKNEFVFNNNISLPTWYDTKKILIDKNEIFIATRNGLIFADSANKQYRFTAENGLGTNYINYVFKDKHSNIYICTYGAGIKIWPAGYLAEFKINGKTTGIFPSEKETYITTTNSVYQYENLKKRINEIKIPMTGNYTGIYKEKNGSIYLGTLNNFYKFPNEQFHRKFIPADASKYVHIAFSGISGFAEHRNNILISSYGNGIYVFDGSDKYIDTLNSNTTPPAPFIIESLVPLGSSIAALTYNSGLTIYDSANGFINLTRHQGLLSNTVYSAFMENKNTVWIGTKNGLNLFDGKNIIKTFTANEGLIGINVLCIFKDMLNRLWILSDKFLHLMDSGKLRAIRSHPVLFDKKNSINRAAYCMNNNTLFIGLTNALLTVDMNKILLDTVVNIPYLAAVLKDTTTLLFQKNELLSLSNLVSKITFRFSNSYHSFIRQYDLYYKLKGFDDNWKLLSNTNEIFYQKLTAGKYELYAKTVNPDGYSSSEISLLTFEVLPPLWKRNWFIAIMSVLLLTVFFYIGNVLSRRKYKQKLHRLQEEYRLQLERERIARELHDNVGSQLTYLINKIDDDYPKLAEKKEAEKLSGFARGAMQELRETIWALDKKEVLWDDLENKIRQLLLLYKNEKHHLELEWQINSHQPALNPLEALNIYRIIQEALNNAEKYSNASQVKVSAHFDNDQICVEITDNGRGFDSEKMEKGYGLKNIKKRAEEMNAGLKIESEPGRGTTVKLYLS